MAHRYLRKTAILMTFPVVLSSLALGAPPMEICIGGGDFPDTSKSETKLETERKFLRRIAPLKASSHETYVRWSMIEPQSGQYNFSFQDTILGADRAAGLKWVPFIVISPAYVLPEWFYKSAEDVGYVCLEHGIETDVQSLWSPHIRKYFQGAFTAFGKHYGQSKDVESVLLGISGNYGETLVPATGLDWTQDNHGPYHTHKGWWIGDRYAVDAFQAAARQTYKNVSRLNQDWNTTFPSFAALQPRVLTDWQTTAAKQFQAGWMLDSMTEFADFSMDTAKRAMRDLEIYLVVGGHAPAHHGLDISAQVKAAARRDCGVRITNEADDYRLNFSITRLVASASRVYGSFFGYEPAGWVSWKGVAARTFNATASGARCLHWYDDNLIQTSETLARWDKYRPLAVQREPVIDVAVFYPRRWMNLQDDVELYHLIYDYGYLRNATDFELVDERMLDDLRQSGRQPFKWFIVREDFEQDDVSRAAIQKYIKQPHAPAIIRFQRNDPQGTDAPEFLANLSAKLHPNDDFTSGVYHSRFKDGTMLFLNQNEAGLDLSVTHPKMVKTPTLIGPYDMVEIRSR
jgi:hypothetical protein